MAVILCVDDDPVALAMKQKILERAGHLVDQCLTAAEATKKLKAKSYDAIITDWRLGDMENARSVIETARIDSGALVIVLSGFTAEAFQSSAPAADLYLDKPVNPGELLVILETLLDARSKLMTGT